MSIPLAAAAANAVRIAAEPASRRRPAVRPWAPSAAALAVGAGFGASLALPIGQATRTALLAPGGLATLAGDLAAMAGTYLLLVMVLLAGRIPGLEAALGQDRLVGWHRRLAPAPLVLLGAHAAFTTLGYAQASRTGFLPGGVSMVTTMAWIFAAVVSYLMLAGIAGASIRAVRRRFSYDTWWVIHLYTYLALAFSVPHQVVEGTSFTGHPAVQAAWLILWSATAGVVVVYRLALPALRSLRHRLRVVSVREEAPGVYSLVVRGHALGRLPVAGGQYLGWRFLVPGLWWHSHPFSLSSLPAGGQMRVTIKVAGDATAEIAGLRPGTWIAIEGPYGAFTDRARTRDKVALIGAGVGITPLRALLEDLRPEVDVVVVHRASSRDRLIHGAEIEHVVRARGGRVVDLPGPRAHFPLDDPAYLRQVIPDIAERDVYVCGPGGFAAGVESAARRSGVPTASIHRESFEF